MQRCYLLFTALFFSLASLANPVQQVPSSSAAFMRLADKYFDDYLFPVHPTEATQLGIHTYDDQLENYSQAAINNQIVTLKKYEKEIRATDPKQLDEQTQGDRELVLNNIRSQLLSLQSIRLWEKDPDSYCSGITNSAFVLMSRQFASVNDRLRSLVAREKLMPAVLQEAHKNIKNPPKIFTEIALEQLPGLIKFFKEDVPAAFASADDAGLKKQFAESNAAVIKALIEYETWLKQAVLPRSHGDYRIGKTTFEKKLKYDEMVDTSLDKLIKLDAANMRQNQKEFARLAHELDPGKTPQEVLADLAADHPAPDQLLDVFHAKFNSLIKLIKDKKIITLPTDVQPIMEETPPFLRAVTAASMDPPGPFEKAAKEAYFNVTLPNPVWSKEQINDFMAGFSYSAISNTAVHEAYPGHYVQFLWLHKVHDRVRQLLGADTNAEGWAHYCEQMMLDEGLAAPQYGVKDEREAKLMRLSQLINALWRNARFIVGIEMHTGKMSFKQAVDFFVKEGYQPHAVGLMEAKRGTTDPTYLYYTLGKLQILKLRADLQAKEGKAFNLQKFHDDFMRQGYPPIKIVRKALLHDDSPTL